MPYALFCNEARLSKAYPTEADVWKLARQSGLVVDSVSDEDKPAPRPVLDNDYEIRPCWRTRRPVGSLAEFLRRVCLRRRHGQGCLLGREHHAGFSAMQPPDGAGHLKDLADGTGCVLHEGNLVGGESQRLRSQDGLGDARRGKRGHSGKNQH